MSFKKKSIDGHPFQSLGIQWVKVTLYFHPREQIAIRLHHGVSETIPVNTLTDIREFKSNCPVLIEEPLGH